jgi:hypothetical protein
MHVESWNPENTKKNLDSGLRRNDEKEAPTAPMNFWGSILGWTIHKLGSSIVQIVQIVPNVLTGLNGLNLLNPIHATANSSPPAAVSTTTNHGGHFQNISNPKAKSPSPKSLGL